MHRHRPGTQRPVGAVAVLLIVAWTGTAALAAGSESPAPDATESRLDPIWRDTASEEPTKAHLAFNKLAGLGESAVALLTGKVSAARPVDAQRIGVLLGQLDAAEFTERVRAEQELARMDRQAVALLKQALTGPISPQQKNSIQILLDQAAGSIASSADLRNEIRAAWLLRRINTDAARAHLKRLAGGDPTARLTELTRAMLADKRPGLHVAFWDGLTGQFSSMWAFGFRFHIRPDGLVECRLSSRGGAESVQTYALSPADFATLDKILDQTKWLSAEGASNMNRTDQDTLQIAVHWSGRQREQSLYHPGDQTYRELMRFFQRLRLQEQRLCALKSGMPAAGDTCRDICQEIRKDRGAPLAVSAQRMLDERRLAPFFEKVLSDPATGEPEILQAAAMTMGALKIASQRKALEALACQERTPDQGEKHIAARTAAVEALGILGPDESIEVLRGLLGKEYKFGQAAIDAVAKARKDLAVGLLAEAARKNEYAGWALIRMGAAGEAGVLALLEEPPGSVGMAQYYLVRQYFDHWDELSAPPSPLVLAAIRACADDPPNSSMSSYFCWVLCLGAAARADSSLEFRVVPVVQTESTGRRLAIPREKFDGSARHMQSVGPTSKELHGGQLQWMELAPEAPKPPMSAEYGKKTWTAFLISPRWTLLAEAVGPGAWGLKRVAPVETAQGAWAIEYELDENGAGKLATLTREAVGSDLAVIVGGQVQAILPIEAPWPAKGRFVVPGPREQAVAMARRLADRMPPTLPWRPQPKLHPAQRTALQFLEAAGAEDASGMAKWITPAPPHWSAERMAPLASELAPLVRQVGAPAMPDHIDAKYSEDFAAVRLCGPEKDAKPFAFVVLQRAGGLWRVRFAELHAPARPGYSLERLLARRTALFTFEPRATNYDRLTEQTLQAVWEDLGTADPNRAAEAVVAVVAAGDTGLVHMDSRLAPLRNQYDQARIRKFLPDLGANEYAVRENASKNLAAAGPVAVPQVLAALAANPTPEARGRLERLLDQADEAFAASAETRRWHRLAWALEWMPTPAAAKLAGQIGATSPDPNEIPIRPQRTLKPEPSITHDLRSAQDWKIHYYEQAYDGGRPENMRDFLQGVLAGKEVLARYERTTWAAYARSRLSGLYWYTRYWSKAEAELKLLARLHYGTEDEIKVYTTLGLNYLQGYQDPATAMAWFDLAAKRRTEIADDVAKPADNAAQMDRDAALAASKYAADQHVARCRALQAQYDQADKTPWPQAVQGVQCRLRLTRPADSQKGSSAQFTVDARNLGTLELTWPYSLNNAELEIDGVWYVGPSSAGPFDGIFVPGCYRNGTVSTHKFLRTLEGGKPLNLASGKHTLRVAVPLTYMTPPDAKPLRVTTGTVEFTAP